MSKNSTILPQWKYTVKHEVHPMTNRGWTVYRDTYPLGRFHTHARALAHATQQAHYESLMDWQLIAVVVDQEWIMAAINQKRMIWRLISRAPIDRMNGAQAINWVETLPLPWNITRLGTVFDPDDIFKSAVRNGMIKGEYYKYG